MWATTTKTSSSAPTASAARQPTAAVGASTSTIHFRGPRAASTLAAGAVNAMSGNNNSSANGISSSGGDDWSLRKNLELCGAVLPSLYADVNTNAHLNTFDVHESGNAVLFSASGRLYVLNLLHVPKKQAQPQPAVTHSLAHVTLDPALPRDEVQQVEQVKLNASGSHVLLIARQWVKVVKLPTDAFEPFGLGRVSSVGAGTTTRLPHAYGQQRSQQRPFALASARSSSSSSQRYSVHFTDGSSDTVVLDAVGTGSSTGAAGIGTSTDSAAADTDLVRVQRIAAQQHPRRTLAWLSRELGAATVRQLGYFAGVQQAAWHPLSDAHVVVLSDADELALFCTVQADVSKPEQRIPLDAPTKSRSSATNGTATIASATIATAFAFGTPTRLWDAFTVFVLRSDGAVHALCPVVPIGCRVPRALVAALRSDVDAHVTHCKRALEAAAATTALAAPTGTSTGSSTAWTKSAHQTLVAQLAELKSQKYWLDETWTIDSDSGVSDSDVSDVSDTDEFMRSVAPHVSGISIETWPLAVQGSVDVTPKSVVEGRHAAPGGSTANSLLRVPGTPTPFLVRAFTSGHVELLLLDAPMRPQWQSAGRASASPSRHLPALLLECLHLGIDDSGGRAVLARDAADPRLVYCLHSTGVHVLNVGWVLALAGGKQFDTLPQTSARHIFSVSPGASAGAGGTGVSNVVGARVVKNVFFGHLLLLRLAAGSFEVVNVSAASSELLKGVRDADALANDVTTPTKPFLQLPGALAPIASTKPRTIDGSTTGSSTNAAVRPFSDIVEAQIEKLDGRGTRVTGHTLLHEVDDAVLAFVVERVKILLDDVAFSDALDAAMRDRLTLHAEMLAAQQAKAAAVATQVTAAQSALKALKAKLAQALAVQQNLGKRAAAVLQAAKENQPTLSLAERAFAAELAHMAVATRRLQPRVAQATVAGQRVARSVETAARATAASPAASMAAASMSMTSAAARGLSDDKKRMCFDVLRAETQLIDDTKALLDDMTASLERLRA